MEGEILSHYRVLERLGGGGQGVVFKALDERLNRQVALKVLPPELTRDDEARERFILEAQAASALDHPNVCTIYEIDETSDGQLFIAMGYYEGETVKTRVERGPLPVEEALRIGIQVAEGLAAAHQAGIIHRDIKPANILLTNDGVPKIVDFGIAKLVDVTGLTQTGSTPGTLAYMSPEQVGGTELDQRTDLWSLGAVLYEMLTGRQAFSGDNQWVLMAAISEGDPEPLRTLRSEIPARLERAVLKLLEKQPARRVGAASEVARELRDCLAPAIGGTRVKRPHIAVAAVALTVIVAVGTWWQYTVSSQQRWAREEALPTVIRLIEEDSLVAAFGVAMEVSDIIPNDPRLEDLWPQMSAPASLQTEPSGADVYFREYSTSEDEWRHLGQTPIEDVTLPLGVFAFRISRDGFATRTLAAPNPSVMLRNLESLDPLTIPLRSLEDTQQDMVLVPGGAYPIRLHGFHTRDVLGLDEFLIDRSEVTNAEFREFVTEGGYTDPQYWQGLDFVKEGEPLSWAEAMAGMLDSTDFPGPATWEFGNYPEGTADHPVGGVSWFEAVAYSNFRGKSLPTLFHWARAAMSPGEHLSSLGAELIPASNFDGIGPVAVGTFEGLGPYGTSDMAGNVREWVWNLGEGDRRWSLGGAWNDPVYMSSVRLDLPPFNRSPENGFRSVRYLRQESPADSLTGAVETQFPDYRAAQPVSDDVFEAYKRMFAYFPTSLNDTVEFTDSSQVYWTRERISIDAAYEDRVTVQLFLPKGYQPPYQLVVVFPGLGAFQYPGDSDSYLPPDFLLRTGRAVVLPVYRGSFDRWDGFMGLSGEEFLPTYSDHVVQWYQDLARTLDYLEGREEIDMSLLAYMGFSFGASEALPVIAIEQRIQTAVLAFGGLPYRFVPEEVDPVNYLPHVTFPVLMLNGAYDYVFPVATNQLPLFNFLGTLESDKQKMEFDGGHILPWSIVTRQTLAWLDQHLGRRE